MGVRPVGMVIGVGRMPLQLMQAGKDWGVFPRNSVSVNIVVLDSILSALSG